VAQHRQRPGETTLHGDRARYAGGVEPAGDGVHAWLQPNGMWGESNAALVVGDGESLLVDTLWTPALTETMLAGFEQFTAEAPIATLVNSHSDGDHTWGNQLLAGTEIVATDAAAHELAELKPDAMPGFRRLGQVLGVAGRSPLPFLGRGAARATGAYVSDMLRPFDFSGIELTRPTRTFEGHDELVAGGRRVELIQVGPAHTTGDLIVWIPDARVVVAADVMFVGVAPVMWAGPVSNWVAALDRIAELDPVAVVPGHGPVATIADVDILRDYWFSIETGVIEALEDGASPADAAREVIGSEGFLAAPWSDWDGPERLVISAHTIARNREGKQGGVSAIERIRIFSEVAAVAAELRLD
jgi:glyoxylase-like metal-dependent hydrolase (beta-lactamase superfamily II)